MYFALLFVTMAKRCVWLIHTSGFRILCEIIIKRIIVFDIIYRNIIYNNYFNIRRAVVGQKPSRSKALPAKSPPNFAR